MPRPYDAAKTKLIYRYKGEYARLYRQCVTEENVPPRGEDVRKYTRLMARARTRAITLLIRKYHDDYWRLVILEKEKG